MAAVAEAESLGTVLVIGGCGFLGTNIVKLLLSYPACSSVHVLSRKPTSNLQLGATYHAGDITNGPQLSSLLDKINPKVIIHTASPNYASASASTLFHTNVTGTNLLLQSATANPSTRALIYTSTDSAIHPPPPNEILTESSAKLYDKDSKIYTYGKTKAIADAAVLAANSADLRTAVIRIPGIYGENDSNGIGGLLRNLKQGGQRVQVGDNKKRFEFCWVGKAAEAHVLAGKALVAGTEGVDGEAFFISDGVAVPFFDFARRVYAFAGRPVAENEVKVMPLWLVWTVTYVSEWVYWVFTLGTKHLDVPSVGIEYLDRGCVWSIDKARERLGYRPVEDQDEVLRKCVEIEVKRLKM